MNLAKFLKLLLCRSLWTTPSAVWNKAYGNSGTGVGELKIFLGKFNQNPNSTAQAHVY